MLRAGCPRRMSRGGSRRCWLGLTRYVSFLLLLTWAIYGYFAILERQRERRTGRDCCSHLIGHGRGELGEEELCRGMTDGIGIERDLN